MTISFSQLADGQPRKFDLEGGPVCVVRIGEKVFAVGDTCSHAEASLSEGEVIDGKIECWLHGAQFDLKTGEAVTPPAIDPIPTYKTVVVGDEVIIDMKGK